MIVSFFTKNFVVRRKGFRFTIEDKEPQTPLGNAMVVVAITAAGLAPMLFLTPLN